MKKGIRIASAAFANLILASLAGVTAEAQYLISSKAGFVNRVEGQVSLTHPDRADAAPQNAAFGAQMQDGDQLSTAAGAKAEVLLNPGSYLRINQNSEIRAVGTGLDQIQFELIKGSAIVEVGELDKKTPIEIRTPHSSLFITKKGLYRVNLDPQGEAIEVAVRQGELYFGTREQLAAGRAFKVKRGKVARLAGAPDPVLAKLDKDLIDDFDTWSFSRAETLTAANSYAVNQSYQNSGGLLAYGWRFNPFYNCYTFIPRRGTFWSPYGFDFSNDFGNCYSCQSWYGYPFGGRHHWRRSHVPPRAISGSDGKEVRHGIVRRVVERANGPDLSSGPNPGDHRSRDRGPRDGSRDRGPRDGSRDGSRDRGPRDHGSRDRDHGSGPPRHESPRSDSPRAAPSTPPPPRSAPPAPRADSGGGRAPSTPSRGRQN